MALELMYYQGYDMLFHDDEKPLLPIEERRRRDRRTPRIALRYYSKSPFKFMFDSGDDQALKNYTKPTIDYFVGMTYTEAKSIEALSDVPGGTKWYLNSRTFSESLRHHPRLSRVKGMIRLLWLLYGPPRLVNFKKRLYQKVESKGFDDVDHCWGIETLS